ncbi:MAG: undecaprenyl/decaprenyl-phosphate alpha-N-acetylglucosaminyl 1-phosphate transferase, partial [Planctomycetes bacterium]|nr:undecaprenyl/decaprenyl-phosphate alpha-N-acetylglucosaminyl 1-phosphate transferase [Planctomycetota bacterium]
TKLSAQILVALILVASGVSITLFLPWKAAGWILTVGWIVFITNAFNLLDNMDGLAAGVAFIIAVIFFAVALTTGQMFIALFLAVFAGAVLGFLVFNFPPARIFMGDTGSYVLGYFLGVAAVVFTFVPEGTIKASVLPLVLPFLLFAVPLYDTVSVIVIRLREGRHPFEADKRHFSHRLVDLGMKRREAVLTIYAATLVTAFPALYLYELNTLALAGAVIQAFLVLSLIAVLEHAGARKNR